MTIPCFKIVNGQYIKDPPDPPVYNDEPEETPEERERKNTLLKTYPYNLAFEIFNDEEKALCILLDVVDNVLDTLTEREANILRMRFRDNAALREIGKAFGVSYQCIYIQKAKALRKMRHKSRTNVLLGIAEEPKIQDRSKIEALKLSPNSYNALRYAGINDIKQLECMTKDDLLSTRYLGKKSVNEIILAMESFGTHIKAGEESSPYSHLLVDVSKFEKLICQDAGEESANQFSVKEWGHKQGYFGFLVNPYNEEYLKITFSIAVPHQSQNPSIDVDIRILRENNEANFDFDFPYKKVTKDHAMLAAHFIIDFTNMLIERDCILKGGYK